MIVHLHFPLQGGFYPSDFQTFGLQYHGQPLSAFAFFAFPLIIGVTMAFFRMQFVKFNNILRIDCFIGAISKAIEIEINSQHFDEFFLQNHEKSKYQFLTFLPVTLI